MSAKWRKYLIRGTGVLVICGIYAFILRQVSFDFSDFREADYSVQWAPALAAAVLIFVAFFFRCLVWNLTFREFGHALPLSAIARILAVSNLGRYIPGKVATVGGVLYLASEEGVPPRVSGTALFVNLIIPLLTAAFVFAGCLIFLDIQFIVDVQLWIVAGVVLATSLALLQPPVFNRLVPFLFRQIRKGEFDCQLSYRFIYGNACLTLLSWAMQGVAFFLLSSAFFETPLTLLPYFIGGNAVAFVIGLVSVFAPAGLGVKEGVLYLVLVQAMPYAQVAILVLVWRLYTTVVELILAGVFFFIGFLSQRPAVKD